MEVIQKLSNGNMSEVSRRATILKKMLKIMKQNEHKAGLDISAGRRTLSGIK